MKTIRLTIALTLAVLMVGLGIVLGLRLLKTELSEEQVREVVISTIQREAGASFYVTGYIDLTATAIVENTKYFLPNLIRFDLGTTRSSVRVPGRVSYGFDVRTLRPEMISVRDDGVVEVALPDLQVYSVEPYLEQMEIETSIGWARSDRSSGRRVERRAVENVRRALRTQGEAHLQNASQPRVNTAEALETLLSPVLEAAGFAEPRFRFQIRPGLTMEPES